MTMKSDEWGTPDQIYEMLPKGGYFDPCPADGQAIQFNKRNGEVTIWRDGRGFNEFLDGLKENWGSQNFVNPPFSNIEAWILKAYDEYNKHGHKTILVLPSHTDRRWFLRTVQPMLVAHPIVWTKRFKYIPLEGQKESQPQFGTGLLMIGYDAITVLRMVRAVKTEAEREVRGKRSRKQRQLPPQFQQSQPLQAVEARESERQPETQ